MTKLTIRRINFSGFLSKIDFSKLSKDATFETIKSKYFSGNNALTAAQENELKYICSIIVSCKENSIEWTSDGKSLTVEISSESQLASFKKFEDFLANFLQFETEIIFEGSKSLFESVVARISQAQNTSCEKSKLSRLVFQNIAPTEKQLKTLVELPTTVKKAIIVTQNPNPSAVNYNIEVNFNRAATDSFAVDYRYPFAGELSLVKVMTLAASDCIRRVRIENAEVNLEQLRELRPWVSESCITELKKVEEKWCFNSRPAEVQSAKHVLYVDVKSTTEELQLLMECIKPQALEFEKDAFNALITLTSSIKEITIKDASLGDNFCDKIQSFPSVCELHLLRAKFINPAQREKFIIDVLPKLKLTALTLDGCALDERDSKHLAEFLRTNQRLRILKVLNAASDFRPFNLAAVVVSENNNTLVELIDDAGRGGQSQDLKKSLDRNQKFKKFIEDRDSYNNALRAFNADMESNPPEIERFIRNLETLYVVFDALLRSFNNVIAYPNNKLVKDDFPNADKIQSVKTTLCNSLIFYFRSYAAKEQNSALIKNLYDQILKFFLVARQSETELLSAFFVAVKIRSDLCEFAYTLLKKAQTVYPKTTYPSFDKKLLTKKFYADTLETFVHSDEIPPAAWWTILERLCNTDPDDLNKDDKIVFLRNFVLITVEKYLLPQLKIQFKESPKLGNKSIDPAIVEVSIKDGNITLPGLFKLLENIWNVNVQTVLVPFTGGLPPCDEIVKKLLHHLRRVWQNLFEEKLSGLSNVELITKFSPVISYAPADFSLTAANPSTISRLNLS